MFFKAKDAESLRDNQCETFPMIESEIALLVLKAGKSFQNKLCNSLWLS